VCSTAAVSEREFPPPRPNSARFSDSRELIEDKAMFPTRGQTLIVRAVCVFSDRSARTEAGQPWVKVGMNRRSPDGPTFIIPRSSGLVVLGGTQLAHDADTSVRPETTAQIGQRCVDLMPELLPPEKRSGRNWKDLDIVSENVGLRPSREGGVRVHAEVATTRHGVASQSPRSLEGPLINRSALDTLLRSRWRRVPVQ
jgi:D-amino-acid oxidase